MARLVLAATLCANYGIYGPAYELAEAAARDAGGEEYLDSEKYQLRSVGPRRAGQPSAADCALNRIRRENPALQSDWSLRFLETDNDQLLCYSEVDAGRRERRSSSSSISIRTTFSRAGSISTSTALGVEENARPSRCTTCSPAGASSGTAREIS